MYGCVKCLSPNTRSRTSRKQRARIAASCRSAPGFLNTSCSSYSKRMRTQLLLLALVASMLLGGSSAARTKPMHARPALLGLDRQHKDLRVLAFGDSITEGWINSRYTKVPWSPKVEQQLKSRLGGDWSVEVVNGGVGSAGVLDRLNDAFRNHLSSARSANRPFHYITFEAGINDLLLQHKNAPEIFARMKELWALANAEGSTVVVIPTLPTNVGGEREQQRQVLTGMVRQYVSAQRTAGNKGLFLLDLEQPFDYDGMSEQRRQQVFDDGIHMTEFGYQLLGELAYQGLVDAMGL